MKYSEVKWTKKGEWERSKSEALIIDGRELYIVRRHDCIGTDHEYYLYDPELRKHIYDSMSRFELLGLIAKARPFNAVQ